MSRPFSYNDKNFTVIGNVLFVHFRYEDAAEVGTRLIEIPPAICDRLLFFSNICSAVYMFKEANAGNILLTVTEYNNKCYFSNKVAIGIGRGRYIYGTFMLKDI